MDRTGLRRTAIVLSATGLLSLRAFAPLASAGQPGTPGSPGGVAESVSLRARGLELGYNLDHEEALAAFQAAIAADPSDPAPHRLIAATMWINLLFRQGAVTVDDYLGQARADLARTPPPAELDAAFRAQVGRALALAEQRLRDNPADADAHFQVGAAHGFLASYTATVDGRVLGGVRAARRAYREHKRVIELDPRRKDAGLIVGMYRYAVSTLPAPWRLLAGIAGFGGGRQRGLRMVEEAAAYPSDVQTNALFALIVIYNREERHGDALRVIGQLQRLYPRNRLLWLEAASTALRAGQPAEARKAIEEGLARLLHDPRPRAFGEEARWRYYHGAALVASRQVEAADCELRAVLTGEAHDWLRGRAHKELGKLADLAGDRARAAQEYRLAARICRAHRDSDCSEEAAALMKAGYR
jgi:tetratricopeptide (TPR) repeat protein